MDTKKKAPPATSIRAVCYVRISVDRPEETSTETQEHGSGRTAMARLGRGRRDRREGSLGLQVVGTCPARVGKAKR